LRDDVIGDGVSLRFGQPLLEPAYYLARVHQGIGEGVPKHFTSCHDL
jgi:hypothetical protein